MSKIPYVVILIVFFIPFLARGLSLLPGASVLLFEAISGLTLLVSLVYCAYHKSLFLSLKYLFLFLLLCLLFVAGAVVNAVDPAVVFSGIRSYVKYVPLFVLPLVYPFVERQINGQLKFLIALGLLQLPLVIIEFGVLHWGQDIIGGTFGIGSFMSIFMASAITILAAFYFRGRISGRMFFVLSASFFIPTTLNESKGTLLLLLAGLLSIMMGANLKRAQLIVASVALIVMSSCFVLFYDMLFNSVQGTGGYISFFSTDDPNKGIIKYLFKGDSIKVDPDTVLEAPSTLPGALPSFDAQEFGARRIDSMILPLRALAHDPVKLLLGVGIGNASVSKGRSFSGQYSFLEEYQIFGNALSRFLWEIGVLGVFLYLLFFGFIYRDARYLMQNKGLPGALAHGWSGVTVIVILSLLYKNIFVSETLSALFWYFSGYIAAKSYSLRMESQSYQTQRQYRVSHASSVRPIDRRLNQINRD